MSRPGYSEGTTRFEMPRVQEKDDHWVRGIGRIRIRLQ